jgi:effector-binding domain-containing protein
MLSEPTIVDRPAQPYVSITERVSMQDIGMVLPQLHPEVGLWLREHGIRQSGAPFWKYDVINMTGTMEVEVGAPIAEPAEGDDRVRASVIPAGRFVTATFTGHPMGLEGATGTLLDWANEQGLTWDMSATDVGDVWGARLEIYETDPLVEPDMSNWVTTLAFRLID